MKKIKIKISDKVKKILLFAGIPILLLTVFATIFSLSRPRDSVLVNVSPNSAEIYLKTRIKPLLSVNEKWDYEISSEYVGDYRTWVSVITLTGLQSSSDYTFQYRYNLLPKSQKFEFTTKEVPEDIEILELETGSLTTSTYAYIDTEGYDLLIRTNPESNLWAFDRNRIDTGDYTVKNYLNLEVISRNEPFWERSFIKLETLIKGVNAQAQDCIAEDPPESPGDEFCQAAEDTPRTIEDGKERLLEDYFLYSIKKETVIDGPIESHIDYYEVQDIESLMSYIEVAIDDSHFMGSLFKHSTELKAMLENPETIANVQGILDCQMGIYNHRGYDSWDNECWRGRRKDPDTPFYPEVAEGIEFLPAMYEEWVNGNDLGYASLFFLGIPDIICESIKAGVDPLWVLTVWVHESNGSNYGCNWGSEISCTIDFGAESVGGDFEMRFNSQLGYILVNTRHSMTDLWSEKPNEKNTPLVFWNWHKAAPVSVDDLKSSFIPYYNPIYGDSKLDSPVLLRTLPEISKSLDEFAFIDDGSGNTIPAHKYSCGDTSAPHIYLESYDICANPSLAKNRTDLYNHNEFLEAYNQFMGVRDGSAEFCEEEDAGKFCTRADGALARCDGNGNCRYLMAPQCYGEDREGGNCIVNYGPGKCSDDGHCIPVSPGTVEIIRYPRGEVGDGKFPLTQQECTIWGQILYDRGLSTYSKKDEEGCAYNYLYDSCYGAIAYDSRHGGGTGGYGNAGMVDGGSGDDWDDHWDGGDDDPPNQTNGYCCGIVPEGNPLDNIVGDWEFDSEAYPGICYDTWEVGGTWRDDTIAEVIELSAIPDSDTCQQVFEGVCCIKGSSARWYPKEYCSKQVPDLDRAQCEEYDEEYESININLEPGFNFITWQLKHPVVDLTTEDVFDIDENIILIAQFKDGVWKKVVARENGGIAGQHFQLCTNIPYLFVTEEETVINIQGAPKKRTPELNAQGWHFISPVIDGELLEFDEVREFVNNTDYNFNQSAIFNPIDQNFEYYISKDRYNEHYDSFDYAHGVFVKISSE